MPKHTFEQKWEDLRREGKLEDRIAQSQQDYERSQAVEPPEVESKPAQQAVLAQAGRGTPTSSRFAQEVLARSRAALSASATAISGDSDPDPDPFHNFDEPLPGEEDDKPQADMEDSDGDELKVALRADATVDDTGGDDVDEVDHRIAAASSKHMLMDDVLSENLSYAAMEADLDDDTCMASPPLTALSTSDSG